MRKLFGEVISQNGFGFHENLDAVRVASSLIESIKNFAMPWIRLMLEWIRRV
ncbi:MAG: hypothetical protein HC797_03975 [Anaerolineales bacterium]|nr:hypothetical protein [Anaerolineales bacterium]